MADVLVAILSAYTLVAFVALIRLAISKNKTAGVWYLALNMGSLAYLAMAFFARDVLVGDTDTLSTAVMSLFAMGAISLLSIIGVIVSIVKIQKYKPGKAIGDAVFVIIFLMLPIFIFGFARINNDASLRGADLVFVGKSYNGFTEASRTNIVVTDSDCTKVDGKLTLPSDSWQRTTQVYWAVEPGGETFRREHDTLNLVLGATQKIEMQAIFKDEIGDGDPSEYCGVIYPIDGTDYYITRIQKNTETGCFGDYLESHLYKGRQRICPVSSSHSEIYYKK